ncbi:hypothetical protein TNCV_3502851 [Trichonephila clavipes]|uniref:Uncharacterized protein n=1 Tax=Trichonephila clavipes TaxID=2585209 RepID=A0A8X6V7P8_TRICX|nr:hypothetical protein TNCV_3502851 [Trichonephila clavipes]
MTRSVTKSPRVAEQCDVNIPSLTPLKDCGIDGLMQPKSAPVSSLHVSVAWKSASSSVILVHSFTKYGCVPPPRRA